MSNFFAQPDALAVGRAFEDVLGDAMGADGGDLGNCPHRTLSGRPARRWTLLLDKLDAFHVGALLSLYEHHRCAVQGFVWDINSFDQWGVQLGKDCGERRAREHPRRGRRAADEPVSSALLERGIGCATRAAPPCCHGNAVTNPHWHGGRAADGICSLNCLRSIANSL